VEVEDHHRSLGARPLDELVHELERAGGDLEEEPAQELDDGDARAVRRGADGERAPGGEAREVRGPDDAVRLREIGLQLAPRPRVVAEREDVRAGGEQLVRELWRQTAAVGRVLRVDDAEGDVELLAERPEPLLDRAPTRSAEDVREEEDPQGRENVAAGRTTSETWLPASCV